MKRWLHFPFYPFILATLAPLTLYSRNVGFFEGVYVARLILVMLLAWAVAFAVLRLVLRSRDLAGFVLGALTALAFVIRPDPGLAAIVAALLVVVAFATYRFRLASDATIIANAACLALLGYRGLIIASQVAAPDLEAPLPPDSPIPELAEAAQAKGVQYPSVVHILLDAYSGKTTLQKLYDFDNSGFEDALRNKGFLVIGDVDVPYNGTLLSASSVMNAAYPPLAELTATDHPPATVGRALGQLTVEGAVVRAFRDDGHRIYYTASGYNAFRYPRSAEVISDPPGPFTPSLFDGHFQYLYLDPLGLRVLGERGKSATLDWRVRAALTPEVADRLEPPFFLYSHVLSPHPPFTIDRNGDPRDSGNFVLMEDGREVAGARPRGVAGYRLGYAEKLRFTNWAVLAQLDRIMRRIEGPLVIVIHGDHGGASRLDSEDPDKSCLSERMTTTVAVYSNVPGIREAFAHDGVGNIVNIYRVLFSALAGTRPDMADEQYFALANHPFAPVPLAGKDFQRNCN